MEMMVVPGLMVLRDIRGRRGDAVCGRNRENWEVGWVEMCWEGERGI
jgi:hypothetical protein